ncbi:MAG TPA: signal peptidase I, partial [Vitreimonas sp.]|nr:signal peptidase I [Vitreimonas sp.]
MSQRPALGCLFEIVETLALTLIIFFVIQTFIAQPYRVEQQSMEQTLEPDQYVLVDKLTPRFDSYKRGDIVVFNPPIDWIQGEGTPFIKRVIGVAGDDVEIRDDGLVYVNNVALDEPYLFAVDGEQQPTTTSTEPPRWTVADGELFVMGDHRMSSSDSRTFGSIRIDNVIGRAWLRYWPFDTFTVLPTPTYPE